MEEQNKNIEQQNQEPSVWKKYITGKNILIAFLPAVIIVSILRVIGIGGALVMAGVLFGVTFLVGSIREKMSKKNNASEKVDKAKKEEIIRSEKPRNKKTIWIIVLLIIGAVILFFVLDNPQKSNNGNLTSLKTQKEEIKGSLYRNNQYDFRIRFPEGWDIKDGDGPHIIKKAVKNEDGSTVAVLVGGFFEGEIGQSLLNEMKQEYKKETGLNISDADAIQVMSELTVDDFSDEEFKEMMSGISSGMSSKFKGSKVVEEGIRYIDNQKAFYTKIEGLYRVLDIDVRFNNIQYATLHKGNFYIIGAGYPRDDFLNSEEQVNLSIGSFVFENF